MSKRILVVEDQPDNRQIIRDMLAPTDYHEIEDKSRQLEEASQHKSQFLANMWARLPLGTIRRLKEDLRDLRGRRLFPSASSIMTKSQRCCHLKPNFASTPARSIILAKPAEWNGAPRSDVNTNPLLCDCRQGLFAIFGLCIFPQRCSCS